MPRQHAADRQPGAIPDIREDTRGVEYVMRLTIGRATEQLIIRCDPDGEVWISITPEAEL